MSNKRTLTLSILGKSYSLLTDEDRLVVEDAALLVESLLNQMAIATASPADAVKKTTFVALTLAVDLLKERKALQDAGSKTTSLNTLLRETLSI